MAYYAKITNLGLTRLAEAQATGVPLVFSEFAVGDGGGVPITPVPTMTALVNERYRGDVNAVGMSPYAAHTIYLEGVVPAASGGLRASEAASARSEALKQRAPGQEPLPSRGGVSCDARQRQACRSGSVCRQPGLGGGWAMG